MAALRALSLCSGIGGCELGLRPWAHPVVYVEREASAAAVLLERMEAEALEPAPVWCGNLADFDPAPLADLVDLVVAGIPCQPWSLAGSNRGQADERHLGDDLLRIVRVVEPAFVFVENVYGFIRDEGLGHLLGALADLGFDAEWTALRASDVGAPHRRRRVFVLAYADSWRRESVRSRWLLNRERAALRDDPDGCSGAVHWQQRPMPEPAVQRVAHGLPGRVDALRLLGNAAVPQQVRAAFGLLLTRALA